MNLDRLITRLFVSVNLVIMATYFVLPLLLSPIFFMSPGAAQAGKDILLFMGGMILMVVLGVIVNIGLWFFKNWARIISLIFLLMFLSGVSSLLSRNTVPTYGIGFLSVAFLEVIWLGLRKKTIGLFHSSVPFSSTTLTSPTEVPSYFKSRIIVFVLLLVVVFLNVSSLFHVKSVRSVSPMSVADCTKKEYNLDVRQTQECLLGFLPEIPSSQFCEQVADYNDVKAECFSRVAISSTDISLCQGFGDTKGYICVDRVAFSAKNSQVCNQLSASNMRERCYLATAAALRDPSMCQIYSFDQNKLDSCLGFIVQRTGDVEICEQIATPRANFCYTSAAVASGDLSHCHSIVEYRVNGRLTKLTAGCYKDVAEASRDATICQKIDPADVLSVDSCYSAVGEAKKDPLLCAKIIGDDTRDTCYSFIATEEPYNVGLCALVAHSDTRDNCYQILAGATNDYSLCNKVQDAESRNSCRFIGGLQKI